MVFIVIPLLVVLVFVVCWLRLANLCCFRFFALACGSVSPSRFFISVSVDAVRVFGLSATLNLRPAPFLTPPQLSVQASLCLYLVFWPGCWHLPVQDAGLSATVWLYVPVSKEN